MNLLAKVCEALREMILYTDCINTELPRRRADLLGKNRLQTLSPQKKKKIGTLFTYMQKGAHY